MSISIAPPVSTPAATSVVARSMVSPKLVERLVSRVSVSGAANDTIEVRAPFTGELLALIPRCSSDDVVAAVERARRAQVAWSQRSHRSRRQIFLRFHDLVLDRQEEALDLIQLESGKARRHAFEEVMDTAVVTRHYAYRAESYLRTRRRRGALPVLTQTREFRHPVGVVGCIVPWNYPLNLGITDAIAALLAGNGVVLKPDHQTSLTALWAVDLLLEAGLPADVLPVVTGEGPALGPALMKSVDFVMFTGSTATGRVIARQAADRLIGMSLELGGKNPMLVLRDADIAAAVEGAIRGCFVGAGQVCVSLERIYIHTQHFDRFAESFVQAARALRLGTSLDYLPEMGSLASERQLHTVSEHVRDAVEQGATLLCGGRARPDIGPYFFEPTVLTKVTEGMRVHSEETFGPVVTLYRCESDEEAIRLANQTSYGLSASVWGRDVKRAVSVARRVRAGSVNVNEAYAATWGSTDAAIGGMKESGLSRRHGEEGILKYTEVQTVAVQRLHGIRPPPGVSHELYARVMTKFLRLMRHVPGLR
jgi:succinate-semialdehyde dehydrogenase / glutarate-semialdehyde dehydrogenase